MRYTVVWLPTAQDDLARIWMQAPDRQAVTKASHRIDQILSVDPDQKGTDFYGDRYLGVLPLAIVYRIRPDDCLVEILQVWHQ